MRNQPYPDNAYRREIEDEDHDVLQIRVPLCYQGLIRIAINNSHQPVIFDIAQAKAARDALDEAIIAAGAVATRQEA